MTNGEVVDALKHMIVDRLQLKIAPSEIGDDEPLFGEGLGLDSVEALELVVGIEERFGITVRDAEEMKDAFSSVNALAQYVTTALESPSGITAPGPVS